MQKNKILFFSLYCLVGALIFISCQKDNSITDEQNIDVNIIDGTVIDNPPTISLENQATSGIVVIKDILMIIFQQSLLQPELWGLQGEPSVDVRDSCPDTDNSTSTGTLGDAGATYNLQLDFDASCAVGLNGTIQAEFTEKMFTDDRIDVTISNGFKIGDYTVSDDNGGVIKIQLLLLAAGDGYKIKIVRPITFEDGDSNKTVYEASNDLGNFKLDDTDGNDTPTNPITYLDDQIELRLKDVMLECLAPGETDGDDLILNSTPVGTGGGVDRLIIDGFACKCIEDGSIDISGDASATLDFGYNTPAGDGSQTNNGGCDSWARNTTTNEAEELDSCN